jgi:protein phosphatase
MMKIKLSMPLGVSDRGSLPTNEDALSPLPESASEDTRLFVVCDGVSYLNNGAIASEIVSESLPVFFSTFLEGEPDKNFIARAIRYAEIRIDEYLIRHPDARGMGTTLAMAYIGKRGVTVAHIGDSRVYHIRGGEILFQTYDDSLVNRLLKTGELKPEDARTYPGRSIIGRYIRSSLSPTHADITVLTDIRAGDYIFICTDGVIEALDNTELSNIFTRSTNALEIKEAIVAACVLIKDGNYTFYLLPITGVESDKNFPQQMLTYLHTFV